LGEVLEQDEAILRALRCRAVQSTRLLGKTGQAFLFVKGAGVLGGKAMVPVDDDRFKPVFLTLEDVLPIHDEMIDRLGGTPQVHDIGLLKSAIAQPQAQFAGRYRHPDLLAMARRTRIASSGIIRSWTGTRARGGKPSACSYE
jgi:hypothetical protein